MEDLVLRLVTKQHLLRRAGVRVGVGFANTRKRGINLKVMHLMGSLRPSGMERMFISAARYFSKSGCDSIIVGQGEKHSFIPELTEAGYRVEKINPLKTIGGVAKWVRLLRSERPDVIHIHTEGAFALSVLAARFALPGTPIVRTVHNVFTPTGRAYASRRIQGLLADLAIASFIAVSPDVQANEKLFNRRSQLIFNWVDDKFYLARKARANSDGDEAAAVMVGNASPIKNHSLALRAILNSRFFLYYHGDESGASSEETSLLDQLEAEGRIRYRGIGDPTESLSKGSVFLLPSKHEGMPIALSEALVVGLPAIVNDVPGVQWARDFRQVVVVANQVEDWEEALLKVCDVENEYFEPSELPLDLSAERGVRELIEVYLSVIPPVPTPTPQAPLGTR